MQLHLVLFLALIGRQLLFIGQTSPVCHMTGWIVMTPVGMLTSPEHVSMLMFRLGRNEGTVTVCLKQNG